MYNAHCVKAVPAMANGRAQQALNLPEQLPTYTRRLFRCCIVQTISLLAGKHMSLVGAFRFDFSHGAFSFLFLCFFFDLLLSFCSVFF